MSVVPFKFQDRPLRVITNDDGSWLVVAKDVVEGLGGKWSGRAVSHVPEQWKGMISDITPGGTQRLQVLTEHGLYFFLGRSDKPDALPYQMWLAGEVVPTIRQNGHYGQTYQGAAVLRKLDDLQQTCRRIDRNCQDTNETVHDFADNQRHNFPADVERAVCGTALRFFGGMCPNCKETKIIDSGGNRIPYCCQLDHNNGRQNTDRKNCWPLCVKCHGNMRVQGYRLKHAPNFEAFQLDLDRYCAPLLNPPPVSVVLASPPDEIGQASSAGGEPETEPGEPEPPKLPAATNVVPFKGRATKAAELRACHEDARQGGLFL